MASQRDDTKTDDYKGFRVWMGLVDAAIASYVGLSSADLPVYPFRDAFDDGSDPAEVAGEMLEEAGFLMD